MANADLTIRFPDLVEFFAENQTDKLRQFGQYAKENLNEVGELEFEANPIVSAPLNKDPFDTGAYVMAWVWVPGIRDDV